MGNQTLVRERAAAIALSVTLIAVALSFAYRIFSETDFIGLFPPVSQASWLLSAGGLVFVISATDMPAALRRSPFLRVQAQCWCLWMILSAVVQMLEGSAIEPLARVAFAVAVCLLAVYSLFANWKPLGLLG